MANRSMDSFSFTLASFAFCFFRSYADPVFVSTGRAGCLPFGMVNGILAAAVCFLEDAAVVFLGACLFLRTGFCCNTELDRIDGGAGTDGTM